MKRSLAAPALAGVALALAGCGTAAAPGIEAAPSAGRTSAPPSTTPTTSTQTTPTTPTTPATPKPTVPLPAAFNHKPVVSIPAGAPPKHLVIKDLIKGTGPVATAASTVTVQYVGELFKGHKQFDASWNDGAGKPVSFGLNQVIKGWTEGIPGMKEGGRRELIIPPSLAYGKTARPGTGPGHAGIPANSTLVFVIDLHAVS